MSVYEVGDALTSSVAFRTDATPPVLADPTAVTAFTRSPAGAVTDRTTDIVKTAVGSYKLTVVPSTPGVWVIRWVGVGGPVTATDEKTYAVRPLSIDGFLLGWYGAGPATSDRDKLRLLLGDTNNDDVLLLDGEIDWILTRNTVGGVADFTEATIVGVLALAAKFSRLVDGSNGDLSRSYSQRATAYKVLAESLRKNANDAIEAQIRKAAFSAPTIRAGGLDTGPDFALGMWDGPGTVLPGRERNTSSVPYDPRAT